MDRPGIRGARGRVAATGTIMITTPMKNEGPSRLTFALAHPPTSVYPPRKGRRPRGEAVPAFEPYAESLPLQSGWYSFAIDPQGRIHVKWGNTSSHAAMVGGQAAAGAGRFRVNRAGRLVEIDLQSTDYGVPYQNPTSPACRFIGRFFHSHPALELSSSCVFRFFRKVLDDFTCDVNGRALDEATRARRIAEGDAEGVGQIGLASWTPGQIAAFAGYRPQRPTRLYGMHRDQLVTCVEADDADDFEYGPPEAALTPKSATPADGKSNFVIDGDGRLIVGARGHQILSGGQPVGAAGHLIFDAHGGMTDLHLNFSGHYRPELSAEYARSTYRAIVDHPLIQIAENCRVKGRKFSDDGQLSTIVSFAREDLESDDVDLETMLEFAFF